LHAPSLISSNSTRCYKTTIDGALNATIWNSNCVGKVRHRLIERRYLCVSTTRRYCVKDACQTESYCGGDLRLVRAGDICATIDGSKPGWCSYKSMFLTGIIANRFVNSCGGYNTQPILSKHKCERLTPWSWYIAFWI